MPNFHMLIICCGRGKKGDERTGSERSGRREGDEEDEEDLHDQKQVYIGTME